MKKNYFKILLVVFVINLLSAPILFAQGAYLNINTGYAMSMGSQNINNFTNQTLTSSILNIFSKFINDMSKWYIASYFAN